MGTVGLSSAEGEQGARLLTTLTMLSFKAVFVHQNCQASSFAVRFHCHVGSYVLDTGFTG